MDHRHFDRAIRWIGEFRRVDPHISATAILAFLAVVKHEGTSQQELQDILGVEKSYMSRVVGSLTAGDRGRPGLAIIERRRTSCDRRVITLYLTTKGRLLRSAILAIAETPV